MKHTITTILIQATIAVSAVFSSYAAQASGCSLRNDSMVDTRDLGEFVKAEMNPIKKVSLNAAVPSERYFRIDRNSSDYPELQMLNTDGILTSTEDVNVGLLKSGQRGYAQVVPFTKCHWFSNIHVVNGIALERQEQLKIGTEVYGSFGQGNSCEGKESFKVAGVKAQLAGYNPNSYNEKTGEFFNDMDWAVLKQNAAVKGLPVARICENSFSVQDIGIATGTPVDQIVDWGFSVLGA